MTITLTGVAASTTPTVVKTFFEHYKTQWKKDKADRWTEATDELMFHEAFAIVKRFIDIATTDTVEALQSFTNTHVPAQPGTTSLRSLVPLSSCDQAAELLIQYFGDDDLRLLVGGRLWWQVRGLRGVQAEWIAMREDWKRATDVEQKIARGQSVRDLEKRAKEVRRNKRHERKHSGLGQPFRHALDRRRSGRSVPSASKVRNADPSHKSEHNNDDSGDTSENEDEQAKRDDKHKQEGNPKVLDESRDEPSESFEELDRLKRVMYYIHGGGYYFGSLSTHRLMITRFARKFGGRAFAVNYRKAPQYPWPCAVQDVLAGYLYLIRPPPEARHKAIDPAQIVVAGDSAGGGLSLALLCILRDLDLPMPAGGVLLSPWCDMTHSFPSILQNTATDIIPRYGFIHKPSTLWPLPDDPLRQEGAKDEDEKGNDVSLQNDDAHAKKADSQTPPESEGRTTKKTADKAVEGNAAASLASFADEDDQPSNAHHASKSDSTAPMALKHLPQKEFTVMVQDKDGRERPLKVTRQIQLYATNAQLFHPLCSPILQGSLGGLPPLYILAGDAEVLRDECLYLASRAAHPERYPLKKDLLDVSKSAQKAAERFNHKPTKVHLQVYDGQPHVLTLFSFTTSARYAYRAIASFVKHVTGAPTNVINPFPQLSNAGSAQSDVPSEPPVHETTVKMDAPLRENEQDSEVHNGHLVLDPIDTSVASSSKTLPSNGVSDRANEADHIAAAATIESPAPDSAVSGKDSNGKESLPAVDAPPVNQKAAAARRRRNVTLGKENAYDGQVPLRRPTYVQEMIRERVDIRGRIRPLEDEHLLQALQVAPSEIGKIKEGAVSRYLTGQTKWDERFKKEARRVAKRRLRNEEQVQIMLEQALSEGLLGDLSAPSAAAATTTAAAADDDQQDGWADLARLGPLGLAGETPPPSAIAGRRDTKESVELFRQALHMRAEHLQLDTEATAKISLGTSSAGPRDKSRVKYRSATGAHWKQSAAERQVEGRARYGLKAWSGAMAFFGRRNQEKKKQSATKRHRRRTSSHSTARPPQTRSDSAAAAVNDIDDADGAWVDANGNHCDSPDKGTSNPPVAHA